jgi:integrase
MARPTAPLKLTGSRPSELRGLRWADIDLDRCVVALNRHKTSRTQRTPRSRLIPLVPPIIRLLSLIRRRGEGERHSPPAAVGGAGHGVDPRRGA